MPTLLTFSPAAILVFSFPAGTGALGEGARRLEAIGGSGLVPSAATVMEDKQDGTDNYRLTESGLAEGTERSDKSFHLEQVTDGYNNAVCICPWLHLASN